ncbi:cytochrome b5 type B isoform X2 [Ceratitis capitata]|uniref:cytochrome b5 type B isoform X2 n=1 Tax=Ceratitis capitata TaxID=7213 RepID=UPI000329C7FD|nr:cytochrome b5 type B isoform X2 [Ceratitis capitata]
MDNFKLVTLEELKKHNKPDDLWIAIEGKVYNVTKFRNEHPGGEETLDEVGGLNATVQFNEVGHSQEAKQMLKKYYVGHLVSGEESAAQTAIRVCLYATLACCFGMIVVGYIRNYFGRR